MLYSNETPVRLHAQYRAHGHYATPLSCSCGKKYLRSRGVTLVELLVVLGVVAIVLAILMPSLHRAKQTARFGACLANIRSSGLLLTGYSGDHDEELLFPGYESHRVSVWDEKWINIGGRDLGPNGWWSAFFPDEWAGDQFNQGLRCPCHPAYDPDARTIMEGALAFPTFWMSKSLVLDGTKLKPGTRPYVDAPLAKNRRAYVRYPSAKVELFEAIGYCLKSEKNGEMWINRGQTMIMKTSCLMIDGSAQRLIRNNYIATSVDNDPFGSTINGIYGMDVRGGLPKPDLSLDR